MACKISTRSPIDGSIVVERPETAAGDFDALLKNATDAFEAYKKTSLNERIEIAEKFLSQLAAQRDELGREITLQMGRPIRYTPKEVDTAILRGKYLISVAHEQLGDVNVGQATHATNGSRKFIKRVPIGVVLTITAWNYPYLIAINSVLPALLAGNAVIIKPSPQTPLLGDRFKELYEAAGLPAGVLQVVHIGNSDTLSALIKRPEIKHVCFTGSVAGGHLVSKAASDSFIGVGLELGGKDPAYVRSDANLEFAAAEIADGGIFNSGQSCCSVERVYVHKDVAEKFLQLLVAEVEKSVLGDPFNPKTTMGPVVSKQSAGAIRNQIEEALRDGAQAHIKKSLFTADDGKSNFLSPQVLTNVNHSMSVMKDETFGPVLGVQTVSSDEEAIRCMNDSEFGLTASIWTSDLDRGNELADQVEAGTVFINKADYPDPALAWTGVKNSGRGCTLSSFGFAQFVQLTSRNYVSV